MKKVRTLKIGIIGLTIALVLILFSLAKISSINQSREVNGLADAMTLSCDQTETLGRLLDISPTGNCEDNPEEIARENEYGKESFYMGVGIASGILALTSGGLIFYSKRRPEIKDIGGATNNPRDTGEGDPIEVKLMQLIELKKKGLITEEEYVEKRLKFLQGL